MSSTSVGCIARHLTHVCHSLLGVSSREIKEQLGLAFTLAVGDIWRGELTLYAGDLPAAEQAFAVAAERASG
jgi:hypothetical protein